jgi:hypothetical protein
MKMSILPTRLPKAIDVRTCEELIFLTAQRTHWGTMLSELDELGKMICRRCVFEKRLVEFKGVVYIPPTIKACENETLRKLWIQSGQ